MYFKQHYLACLSHASYLIGDETTGRAVVVDPQRDVDGYVEEADEAGLNIEKVIETHFHADFLSGHLELAERTGAEICYGEGAQADFPITHLRDGERLSLGDVTLEFRATPGHTPESISVVVYEHATDTVPNGVLTGDTLFIGDVGRPDLLSSQGTTAEELARLRSSLNVGLGGRFAEYAGDVVRPDQAVVLVCDDGHELEGRVRLARIGFDQVLGVLGEPLRVFQEHPEVVAQGSRLSAGELAARRQDLPDLVVVDVRNPAERALGAVPGSVAIPLPELTHRLPELDACARRSSTAPVATGRPPPPASCPPPGSRTSPTCWAVIRPGRRSSRLRPQRRPKAPALPPERSGPAARQPAGPPPARWVPQARRRAGSATACRQT